MSARENGEITAGDPEENNTEKVSLFITEKIIIL